MRRPRAKCITYKPREGYRSVTSLDANRARSRVYEYIHLLRLQNGYWLQEYDLWIQYVTVYNFVLRVTAIAWSLEDT